MLLTEAIETSDRLKSRSLLPQNGATRVVLDILGLHCLQATRESLWSGRYSDECHEDQGFMEPYPSTGLARQFRQSLTGLMSKG